MSEQTPDKQIKTTQGTVVSDKMNKTIVVLVKRQVKHARYKKYIRRTAKMHAHDENNQAKIGDVVKIKQSRPYSKMKTWELVEIVTSANG